MNTKTESAESLRQELYILLADIADGHHLLKISIEHLMEMPTDKGVEILRRVSGLQYLSGRLYADAAKARDLSEGMGGLS